MTAMLAPLNAAWAATPSVPYALTLLEEYSEYGVSPPPDICEKEVRNPCVLRTGVMYQAVVEVEALRSKLSASAWSELKRAVPKGQETFIFNVCMDKAREHPNCAAVFGVAVLNKMRVTFYAFFKAKTYPD